MKKKFTKPLSYILVMVMISTTFSSTAQDTTAVKKKKSMWDFIKLPPVFRNPIMQYYRPNDKRGIDVFETSKNDSTPFDGIKVKVGADLTADFQALKDRNSATPVIVGGVNTNQLMPLTNGFNLPMANFNIDAQLADGIRMELTVYLATRHHQDTWVKGGYVQIDKLPFLRSSFVDNVMKAFTIKMGEYDVNYGDQHYRRTDGGNSIYNPFVENYIMDEFATELGGEIQFHPKSLPIIAVFGITDAALNPTVVRSTTIDSATGRTIKYNPAFIGKIGFDKKWKDLRVRLTASIYANKSANMNTLFFGDRTGSHYFFVLENTAATSDGNAWSGRFDPGFSEKVTTFMINPFIKFMGLELFGTYEMAYGKASKEVNTREITQGAVDLVYRFPRKENFWIGGRFNVVTGAPVANTNSMTIYRGVGSVGWFVSKNIVAKLEYVYQQYENYATTNILAGGRFNGIMLEGAISF